MEAILLGVLLVGAFAFLVLQHRYHRQRGHSWDVRRFWAAGAICLAVVPVAMTAMFGAGFLAVTWPFFLIAGGMVLTFGLGAMVYQASRDDERRKAQRAESSFDVVTWLAENDREGVGGQRARRWLDERKR